MVDSCVICEHFSVADSTCHRFPPRPLYLLDQTIGSLFPKTRADDHCGEFSLVQAAIDGASAVVVSRTISTPASVSTPARRRSSTGG